MSVAFGGSYRACQALDEAFRGRKDLSLKEIRSAAMVVNAKSRRGQALFRRACAALSGLPYPVDARAVEDPQELEPTVRELLAAKPDLLILGGGDGTISGLVDLMVGHDVMLGVLPLGTANSFAFPGSGGAAIFLNSTRPTPPCLSRSARCDVDNALYAPTLQCFSKSTARPS